MTLSHRSSLLVALARPLGWCFLSSLLLGLAGCGKEASLPPIIVISVDTLRADRLPAYGYGGVETPALDRLSRESVLFEDAISHCPLTLPSHASLLTGQLPVVHGVRDNLGYRLDAVAHPTLPNLLRPAGYVSGAAVSAYVLRGETGLGPAFDWYDDEIQPRAGLTLDRLERRGEETLERALEWIEGVKEKPFFLFVHLFEPHDPYEAPEPWSRQGADAYDGEVAYADFLVGRFLDELRSRDLYDPSLVVFLSDHGEGLGDHGESKHGLLLYRSTLHVPLLVKLPGGKNGGTRVETPTQLVDVLPTILEVAGVALPKDLPGTSLLGFLRGAADAESEEPGPRHLYSETYYGRLHFGWSELRSLTDDRFHYIESPEPELFDLVSDPGETRNVLQEHRRAFAELRGALEAYPAELEAPEEADPEVAARLAALGYLTAPAAQDGPRPNPKENLQLLEEIQTALELQAAGRLEEAADQLQRLQRERPEVQDVYLLLGPVLRRLGRLDEAVAIGLEGQRRLPTLAPLISLELARAHLAAGDLEAAKPEARAGAAANRSQSHELLARIALEEGNLETAAAEADQALEASSSRRADLLVLRARLHLGFQEQDAALEILDEAHTLVEAGKALPILGLGADRGDLLARANRSAEAELAFRQEMERFPGNLQAYARYAFLLATQRRFDEIEPLFETLAAARPDPRSFNLAADTLERLGNAEAAARWRGRGGGL